MRGAGKTLFIHGKDSLIRLRDGHSKEHEFISDWSHMTKEGSVDTKQDTLEKERKDKSLGPLVDHSVDMDGVLRLHRLLVGRQRHLGMAMEGEFNINLD